MKHEEEMEERGNKLMKEKTANIPLSVDADTLAFTRHNLTRPAIIPGLTLIREI